MDFPPTRETAKPPTTDEPLREGWLVKQGANVKSWKKRWFVLYPGRLTYSRNPNSSSPLGTIPLSHVTAVQRSRRAADADVACFVIATAGRNYYVCATGLDELKAWMDQVSLQVAAWSELCDATQLLRVVVLDAVSLTDTTKRALCIGLRLGTQPFQWTPLQNHTHHVFNHRITFVWVRHQELEIRLAECLDPGAIPDDVVAPAGGVTPGAPLPIGDTAAAAAASVTPSTTSSSTTATPGNGSQCSSNGSSPVLTQRNLRGSAPNTAAATTSGSPSSTSGSGGGTVSAFSRRLAHSWRDLRAALTTSREDTKDLELDIWQLGAHKLRLSEQDLHENLSLSVCERVVDIHESAADSVWRLRLQFVLCPASDPDDAFASVRHAVCGLTSGHSTVLSGANTSGISCTSTMSFAGSPTHEDPSKPGQSRTPQQPTRDTTSPVSPSNAPHATAPLDKVTSPPVSMTGSFLLPVVPATTAKASLRRTTVAATTTKRSESPPPMMVHTGPTQAYLSDAEGVVDGSGGGGECGGGGDDVIASDGDNVIASDAPQRYLPTAGMVSGYAQTEDEVFAATGYEASSDVWGSGGGASDGDVPSDSPYLVSDMDAALLAVTQTHPPTTAATTTATTAETTTLPPSSTTPATAARTAAAATDQVVCIVESSTNGTQDTQYPDPSEVRTWDVDRVIQALNAVCPLNPCEEESLRTNDVDGHVLSMLVETDLRELGFSMGHRKRTLAWTRHVFHHDQASMGTNGVDSAYTSMGALSTSPGPVETTSVVGAQADLPRGSPSSMAYLQNVYGVDQEVLAAASGTTSCHGGDTMMKGEASPRTSASSPVSHNDHDPTLMYIIDSDASVAPPRLSSSSSEHGHAGRVGSFTNDRLAEALGPGTITTPYYVDSARPLVLPEVSSVVREGAAYVGAEPPRRAPVALPSRGRTRRGCTFTHVGNFNLRYQEALERMKGHGHDAQHLIDVLHVVQDFLWCAKTYGRIICAERFQEEKTIAPTTALGGIAGGSKTLAAGILFKFAIDDQSLFRGDDAKAAKVAGHELKGLLAFSNLELADVCLPCEAILDWRGFRLLCITLLPINRFTLIYGSADAGARIKRSDVVFNERMAAAAKALNLREHLCGGWACAPTPLATAVDIEGHKGTDGRYYLLDFSRTFPPEAPRGGTVNVGDNLVCLLRPELVAKFHKPLCSDALSGFIPFDQHRFEYARDVAEATTFLHETVLPELAEELVQLVAEADTSESGVSTLPLAAVLHRAGCNCRHLGSLAKHVRALTHVHASLCYNLILVEIVARVMKSYYRQRLRQTMRRTGVPVDQPYVSATVRFLNDALGDSSASHAFWDHCVLPMAQNRFHLHLERGLREPVAGSGFRRTLLRCHISRTFRPCIRHVLFMKLCAMTGLRIHRSLKAALVRPSFWIGNEEPFEELDVKDIGERIKDSNLVAKAKARFLFHAAMQRIAQPASVLRYLRTTNELMETALTYNPMDRLANILSALSKAWLATCQARIHICQQNGIDASESLPLPLVRLMAQQVARSPLAMTATRIFKRLLERSDADAELMSAYAVHLSHLGQLELSELMFLRALALDPASRPILAAYAESLALWKREEANAFVRQRLLGDQTFA